MTFLAALTTGAVMMVLGAASDWQANVAREVTIQVRPLTGRNIDANVEKAVAVARAAPGIADVRVYTKEEIGETGRAVAGKWSQPQRFANSPPDRG